GDIADQKVHQRDHVTLLDGQAAIHVKLAQLQIGIAGEGADGGPVGKSYGHWGFAAAVSDCFAVWIMHRQSAAAHIMTKQYIQHRSLMLWETNRIFQIGTRRVGSTPKRQKSPPALERQMLAWLAGWERRFRADVAYLRTQKDMPWTSKPDSRPSPTSSPPA